MDENDNAPESGRVLASSLCLDDPEGRRMWLKALRESIDDALAAGDDATRRFSKRVLSRAEARRKLREAGDSIDALLAMAERALETK